MRGFANAKEWSNRSKARSKIVGTDRAKMRRDGGGGVMAAFLILFVYFQHVQRGAT